MKTPKLNLRSGRPFKAKLKLLNETISKAQEAARPAPAESGKRGNEPMPKPQNKQTITATVKWQDGELTGIYWRGTTGGGWKREFFVVDQSGEHIPWRRVMSWRK